MEAWVVGGIDRPGFRTTERSGSAPCDLAGDALPAIGLEIAVARDIEKHIARQAMRVGAERISLARSKHPRICSAISTTRRK